MDGKGTIKTTFKLVDMLTAPLMKITGGINDATSAFVRLKTASDNPLRPEAYGKAEQTFKKVKRDTEAAAEAQKKINAALDAGSKKAGIFSRDISKMAAAYAGIRGVTAVAGLSDQMVGIEARLGMITDSAAEAKRMQDMLFASAQRTGSSYLDTASSVSRLGMLAKEAFADTDEMVMFAEQMNKQFILGGSSAEEQRAAMYQLTQAMASGRLQGDEFVSIMENAPMLAEKIANEMGKSKGELREMSAQGLITADVIKRAMLGSAEETNKAFEAMPMTWARLANMVKNTVLRLSQPVLKIVGAIANNWEKMAPIVLGVMAVTGSYFAMVALSKGITLASAAATKIYTLATDASARATARASLAGMKLNAVLLANPITIVIGAILALIAIFYVVIHMINKIKGTTLSATGMIVGAVFWLGAKIWNIVTGLINGVMKFIYAAFVNPFLGIIEFVLNAVNGGFDGLKGMVKNLIGQLIGWLLDFAEVAVTVVDAVFGTSVSDSIEKLSKKARNWGKTDKAITLERGNKGALIKSIDPGAAYSKGHEIGLKIDDKVKGIFSPPDHNPMLGDYGKGMTAPEIAKEIAGNTAKTADNTRKLNDSVDISNEHMKRLVEMAERTVVNKLTVAEVKLDFSGMQTTLKNETDIDGFLNALRDKIRDGIVAGAEGVHI